MKLDLEASAEECPLSVKPAHPQEPHGRQPRPHFALRRGQFYRCGGSVSVPGPVLGSIAGDRDAPEGHEATLLTAYFPVREKADDNIAPNRARSSVS